MKNSEKLTNIIESILLVSGTQVAISDIAEKLEITDKQVLDCYEQLKKKYSGNSGIQILKFNKKLQFCSNPDYSEQVYSVLNPIKEKELSKSMLEVAAIIAYKQPVTRIDLEEIRGNSEYAVQKLLELGVIEPVGRKDAVGKPVLFGTTDEFLKRFQISSLDELPDYDDLINKINVLHAKDDTDDYLYKKDVYVEGKDEPEKPSEKPAKEEDKADEAPIETKNEDKEKENSNEQNFELPSIEEEEIPDFLKGEDVEKF